MVGELGLTIMTRCESVTLGEWRSHGLLVVTAAHVFGGTCIKMTWSGGDRCGGILSPTTSDVASLPGDACGDSKATKAIRFCLLHLNS